MENEIVVPPHIPEQLHEAYIKKEKEKRKDIEVYEAWWKQLDESRRKSYEELKLWASDSKESHEYHLRRCKLLLEVAHRAKKEDGLGLIPVAMAIHGDFAVVFFQVEGKEKPSSVSKDELSYGLISGEKHCYSDVNTDEYGFPTEPAGALKYRVESEKVEAVDSWMKGLAK